MTTFIHTDTTAKSAKQGVLSRFGISGSDMLAPGALIALVLVCCIVNPNVLTVFGLTLVLSSAIPLALASLAQMYVVLVGDIDLGNGAAIGLVTTIVATLLIPHPVVAIIALAAVIALYALSGLLVQTRRIPAIIVTLGASFVWLGIALIVLPSPGGTVPHWLVLSATTVIPGIPYPILIAAAIALVGWLISMRTRYGAVIRAGGASPDAVGRAGWSMTRVRMTAYGLAGFFIVAAGLFVAGATGSGDAQSSSDYTLLAVASVVLGGGRFSGGRATPIGTVCGALAVSVAGSMLALIGVPSDYQTGMQGLILLAVLAGRVITDRKSA